MNNGLLDILFEMHKIGCQWWHSQIAILVCCRQEKNDPEFMIYDLDTQLHMGKIKREFDPFIGLDILNGSFF